MKKCGLVIVAVCIAVTVLSVVAFATSTPAEVKTESSSASNNPFITVSNSDKSSTDAYKILESRFLNMLNHSFVYDSTFDSVEEMVNASMPALLGFRNSEDNSFIAESYVADYIFDMYGITIDDFSSINAEFNSKDGYVYIIPRGFTKYSHTIVDIVENEDGSYTVITKITSSSHDSGDFTDTCTTLFVPNSESAFGFSIIYSNIGGLTSAI